MAEPGAQFLSEEATLELALMETGRLQVQLQQRVLLCRAIKLLYILEKLEKLSKPSNFNEYQWNDCLTRQDNHPLMQRFINCLGSDHADKIKIVVHILNKQIHSFFEGSPISDVPYRHSTVSEVAKCLLNLEEEVKAAQI